MNPPAKIKKLDEVVVNRIAAGEIIQRPANALKELIENSLDAKATNIQITVKEGGLKLLQIQDNGTGIRKEDMEIVCERFTTSKLQTFEDLRSISTFGFRGEALASISHVALLTITTKTTDEKCAYKASYIDSKLKAQPKSCAGNQGTTITIENLFYNVATRRKALSNCAEELSKITDVVMKYAIHNSTVGFTLKKHGDTTPQVRTLHNSTKMNNVRVLYGNPVFRELLEVELVDETYKFKMHSLMTNPNYSSKRMVLLLFINNRLVDSSLIRKMLEDLYSIYIPKKAHPWCYISLNIEPQNVDVNVHPTKHEVRFLHEDSIIERIKFALDEKLAGNSASRTFYLQARLPKADITKEALEEVLPEYKENADKTKKVHARELIRTDSADQKLDKFNFTIHATMKGARNEDQTDATVSTDIVKNEKPASKEQIEQDSNNRAIDNAHMAYEIENAKTASNIMENDKMSDNDRKKTDNSVTPSNNIVDETNSSLSSNIVIENTSDLITSTQNDELTNISINFDTFDITEEKEEDDCNNKSVEDKCIDMVADKARKRVYQYFGNRDIIEGRSATIEVKGDNEGNTKTYENNSETCNVNPIEEINVENTPTTSNDNSTTIPNKKNADEFKSYSVNLFRREVKLTSVLRLRKEVEDNCHEGLREILSNLTFIGCIDQNSALIQSGVNLYICNTTKLTEELFYEILLYDFANYGIIKFSEPIPLYELAMLGLDTEEAGWTEEDGKKEDLAMNVKELLLEKADMMKEYFSIVIDKKGNLKSLPILIDKYFPYEGGLPLYILRLATEVEWSIEQSCFQSICRETAKYFSEINPVHNEHDWKYVTEHVLYPAIKESLLPPKHFTHDSTVLQIANLPDLYKVFERC
ncbi:hypothetical protein KM043_006454 [Ampulex compressa]|nr:hypothetical protein KM043_006454 [Ampulex compressa]